MLASFWTKTVVSARSFFSVIRNYVSRFDEVWGIASFQGRKFQCLKVTSPLHANGLVTDEWYFIWQEASLTPAVGPTKIIFG